MAGRSRKKKSSKSAQWRFARVGTSCCVYLALAVYLFQPHFRAVRDTDNLIVVNMALAAIGCYILTRRWVSSFPASLVAGGVYGFGPYMLGLARYHPSAGLLAATIPWLFCPAAFCFKHRFKWLRWPLALLPLAAIVAFFQISSHLHFFAAPSQTALRSKDLIGLLAPLVAAKLRSTHILLGFYHVPVGVLLIGLAMSCAARRFAAFTIPVAAVILGVSVPVLEVSPIMWFAIPSVVCAVLVAVGLQGFMVAGTGDRKWLILAMTVMAGLSIASLLLATKYFQVFLGLAAGYARLFLLAGKIYALGAVVMAIIFVMARLKLRAGWLRRCLLLAVAAIDIFVGATYIIDRVL